MTGSSNDPRAFCKCTRQGNAAAAPAKKGRGMAAFANLGGGGCQCNLTHHHQLIYELILHHLDRPFKRFQGVLGAPAENRALRAAGPRRAAGAGIAGGQHRQRAAAVGGRRGHEPGRLLSLAATLMLLARRSTEDPPERREAVQRPHAGLLLWAPHH